MVCYAAQHNQLKPDRGNSGAILSCVTTLSGFFIGDSLMKQIPLTKGKFALVDDEDFGRINQHKWYARPSKRRFYASRTYYNSTRRQKQFHMHREVLSFYQNIDSRQIDHKNHNGLDNRKCNLRAIKESGKNQRNMIKIAPHSSIYKGVCKTGRSVKWYAQITYRLKNYRIGFFVNEVDAAKAYDKKALELFGEFACLNFPEVMTEGGKPE